MMNFSIRLMILLLCVVGMAGCDRLVPANQKMMKDAIKASDQAVRSEEKTWAMVLRIEELSQRLEVAVTRAEAAAALAEKAANEAHQATLNTDQAQSAAALADEKARRAEEAARQAEDAVRRIEAQEGESLQKMLEFMRELGYKP